MLLDVPDRAPLRDEPLLPFRRELWVVIAERPGPLVQRCGPWGPEVDAGLLAEARPPLIFDPLPVRVRCRAGILALQEQPGHIRPAIERGTGLPHERAVLRPHGELLREVLRAVLNRTGAGHVRVERRAGQEFPWDLDVG